MTTLWAAQALTQDGWQRGVRIDIGADGCIEAIAADTSPQGMRVGCLLPAPVNLHSHAFQRAMAGLTERRGPDPRDTFWTWRQLMFRFLDQLTPDDIEAIAALVQMEMLEAGYAAIAEFHYLHHQPGGSEYDNIAELAARTAAAAQKTGIGLTLLPVLYRYGGCDRRELKPGQVRFGNTQERFVRLVEGAQDALRMLPPDTRMGIAPHSLRAVQPDDLDFCRELAAGRPIHMHLAEQVEEVREVESMLGARPVTWLLDNANVDEKWCLIHCTQMLPEETERLARTGAVAGLCPITEASLGDGTFDGVRYLEAGGRFGVGSDSNIRIALAEELRSLDYSQRLRDLSRAALARPARSTGRVLWEEAARGGAQAAARPAGAIAVGLLADLVAVDTDSVDVAGLDGDVLIDSLIFAGAGNPIADVWSAGRHVVHDGRHVARDEILRNYQRSVARLRALL
ncbi:formimidoylglutamate deiminase [Mesorhizobium sp. CAU 1741]|uniref:formimidoylglutamate deiminase n=1 Tax=Mesorhizobium sp. CAU 1741 TaxID=3140366 RepID=UPI00325C1736